MAEESNHYEYTIGGRPSPNEGLSTSTDIKIDHWVNADDLGILLEGWGDALRHNHPPSECSRALLPEGQRLLFDPAPPAN